MLLAALRRLALLLVGASALTAAGGMALAPLFGYPISRAIAIAFYLVGAFLLIAGFFTGNRGPVRLKDETAGMRERKLRWASREEQDEAINSSAIFVTLGFLLICVGVIADTRYELF